MSSLVELTPARADCEHLHVLVDSNPKVPDINASVLGTGPSASPILQAMAQRLEHAGADFLVMVCNAAHFHADDIRSAVGIPFISMPQATVSYVATQLLGTTRCGVLATDGGLRSGVYQEALLAAGIEPLLPLPEQMQCLNAALKKIRAGLIDASVRDDLREAIDAFAEHGVQAVLAACTEIPLAISHTDTTLPWVDPCRQLAVAAVTYAMDYQQGVEQ